MLNSMNEFFEENNSENSFDTKELTKAKRLLESKIAKGQKGFPYLEIMSVTPALASLMLQRNPSTENRSLSHATVKKYAADMSAGRYQGLNGQTIVISNDGFLNDGQHRLNAIIRSGKTIQISVVFGAERESRLTLDQNKVRTNGDYLTMLGIKNGSRVSSTAGLLMAIRSNNYICVPGRYNCFGTDKRPTKSEIHEYAVQHLDEIEKAYSDIPKNWKEHPCPVSRTAAALILIAEGSGDWDAAKDFVLSIISGENLNKSHSEYHARNRMIEEKISGGCPPVRTIEIYYRAWNLRNKECKPRIMLRDSLPELEA